MKPIDHRVIDHREVEFTVLDSIGQAIEQRVGQSGIRLDLNDRQFDQLPVVQWSVTVGLPRTRAIPYELNVCASPGPSTDKTPVHDEAGPAKAQAEVLVKRGNQIRHDEVRLSKLATDHLVRRCERCAGARGTEQLFKPVDVLC